MWNELHDEPQGNDPGDGRALAPYRPWSILTRTRFHLQGGYSVDVDYFDMESKVDLYRDGRLVARAESPAEFPVDGGRIEVATSMYGLKRMHFVGSDGTERVLVPEPMSAEGRRARLAARSPALSRAIGIAAVVILLVALPVGLMQVAEFVTHTDVAGRFVAPFTSPVSLPGWMNTAMMVLGVAAAMERALTLRSHWLVDVETNWFGD